jgi:hypothetical protein
MGIALYDRSIMYTVKTRRQKMANSGLNFPKLFNKGNLNILKQLQPSEVQHSLILGTLLNPNGKHGYGDLFLEEFFNIVIDDNNFAYRNEKWLVTVEKGRFDISIRNKNNTKIIIIENKSNWAEDQPNQLYRYWLRGIYHPQYRLNKHGKPCFSKIIYLSPSFEKQYREQSISRPENSDLPEEKVPEGIIKTVFYREEILNWLEKCLTLVEKSDDVYCYIKQYKDYWRYPMENTIVNQVEEMFCDNEQFTSFLELKTKWDLIKNSWWQSFKVFANKYFSENPVEGWEYASSGNCDFRWYCEEFTEKSLCIRFCDWVEQYSLILWADSAHCDTVKISKLLEEAKYLPIISAFERIDKIPEENHNVKIIERGNYHFGHSMDGYFDMDSLAWYAHYKQEEFLSQILEKLNRFTKDNEVVSLLKEINLTTKKNGK